jgi:single-stranded-DNA-specific exonuclease
VIGRTLAARGVGLDEAPAFLAPRLRDWLPDPSQLPDLDRAVARLADAVMAGEAVGVLGDYDVDGATASALLARYLRGRGCPVTIDIPDRLSEGYGPSAASLGRLEAAGCRLVVTVDSGTTARRPLAAARTRGQEVIVIDHHEGEPELPPALAVVNPRRTGGPLADLAAVGVTFLVLVGLNRELRRRGRFRDGAEPDLRRLLDLVALGTVCDVVPLRGLNRALVAQGLRLWRTCGNPGLATLAREAGIDGPLSAFHLGFVLGPRINAGGRIGDSAQGARLLAGDDSAELAAIAARLERLNAERRELEQRVLAEAGQRLEGALAADPPLLLVAGEGWHPGVVGIVAARLVERHHRPALVVGLDGEVGRGSGRSIPGFDLGAAVIEARRRGLLLEGGGHAMAAGLTVAREALEPLAAFLADRQAAVLGPGPPPLPPVQLDGVLSVGGAAGGAGRALLAAIERLAPFGAGNPEPRFAVEGARVVQVRVVGEAHVSLVLAGAGGGRLRGIAFRSVGTPLGRALLAHDGAPLRLAGRLRPDRGGEAQLQIDDLAPEPA